MGGGELLRHALANARLQSIQPLIENPRQMPMFAVDRLTHLRQPTIQFGLQAHQA